MLDYTAIDFETANSYRGSPCSVGLVKVRDRQVVDTRQWLIRPPEAADGWNCHSRHHARDGLQRSEVAHCETPSFVGPLGLDSPARTAVTPRSGAPEPAAVGPRRVLLLPGRPKAPRAARHRSFVGPVGLEPTTSGL